MKSNRGEMECNSEDSVFQGTTRDLFRTPVEKPKKTIPKYFDSDSDDTEENTAYPPRWRIAMSPGSSFYLLREMSRPFMADILPFRMGSRPSMANYAYRQLVSSNTKDSDLQRLFLLSSPGNVPSIHDGHLPIQNGVSPFNGDNGIIPDIWYEVEYQHGKALTRSSMILRPLSRL